MNNREIGAQKEQQVCAYLLRNHVNVLEKNFRCRFGEIDLIGTDGEYLVFFEVKYRTNTRSGSAADAVTLKKQKTICKVSDYYRMIHKCPLDTPIRYDVIAIDHGQLHWIKDAFAYS